LPDAAALDARARGCGAPPLPAVDWPRDPAWREALRGHAAGAAAARARGGPRRSSTASAGLPTTTALERQADCLLTGVTHGLDLAGAPLVAAALQVYWTHLVLAVQAGRRLAASPSAASTTRPPAPAAGSRPVASVTRSSGESLGQRYLTCSLCSTQWHMVRIKCSHCLSTKSLAYQALQAARCRRCRRAWPPPPCRPRPATTAATT
jgi:FdhE protein